MFSRVDASRNSDPVMYAKTSIYKELSFGVLPIIFDGRSLHRKDFAVVNAASIKRTNVLSTKTQFSKLVDNNNVEISSTIKSFFS